MGINVKVSERKAGTGTSEKVIGIGYGPLIAVNPDLAKKKELYGWADKEDEKEISYQGEKNGKKWKKLCFVFQDESTKKYIEYTLFVDNVIQEPIKCKDGVERTVWINQWGVSSMVDKEENLFRNFTHLQTRNEDKEWVDVLDESGEPIKLIYREAKVGEQDLYKMLHELVTQSWSPFDPVISNRPSQDTNLFIKMEHLCRGAVKDITMYIGTDTYQPLAFMVYVKAKDTENGIEYDNNCINGAWLRVNNGKAYGYKDAIIRCNSDGWKEYDVPLVKGPNKWKNQDIYDFYTAVKRNRHMWEFKPLHVFDPTKHVAAGDQKFVPAEGGSTTKVNDMSY